MPTTRTLLLVSAFCLTAVSIAGAKLEPRLQIGEQALQLNGSGVRTKTLVQIYEAGLYLLKPNTNAASILDADEPMAIRIKITSGFVSRSALVSSLKDGLAQSTGGKTDAFAGDIEQLQQFLADDVKKNDIYDFMYTPNKGLSVLKNGKSQGVIPGLAFKKAFFGIWLSASPVDKDLRKGMLAGK